MVSKAQQRVVTLLGLIIAFGALGLGIAFQGDRTVDGVNVVGQLGEGSRAVDIGDPNLGSEDTDDDAFSPVEGFLPASGAATGCSEAVGVDLAPGYEATLTINGFKIAPEDMNVNLDDTGAITNEVSASRSLGHYTFGPEQDCPNGEVLRSTNNLVQACVFRIEDGPQNCQLVEFSFNLL